MIVKTLLNNHHILFWTYDRNQNFNTWHVTDHAELLSVGRHTLATFQTMKESDSDLNGLQETLWQQEQCHADTPMSSVAVRVTCELQRNTWYKIVRFGVLKGIWCLWSGRYLLQSWKDALFPSRGQNTSQMRKQKQAFLMPHMRTHAPKHACVRVHAHTHAQKSPRGTSFLSSYSGSKKAALSQVKVNKCFFLLLWITLGL